MGGESLALAKGKISTFLEEKRLSLRTRELEQSLLVKEESVKKQPENRELKAEFERERIRLACFRVEKTRGPAARYPNDEKRRLKYGKLLFEVADYEAPLDSSNCHRQIPRTRLEAIFFLGKSFNQDGDLDLAVDHQSRRRKNPIPPIRWARPCFTSWPIAMRKWEIQRELSLSWRESILSI